MLYKLTTWIVLFFFSTTLLGGLFVRYPSGWNKINKGDGRELIRFVCSGVDTDQYPEKGDFCGKNFLVGRWSLQVLYDDEDIIEHAHLELYLGSGDFLKHYYVTDLAAKEPK